MPNLRVVYDNAADRATIAASSTAGSLVPANLKTDYKSEVWRSTSLTASLTVTFATAELIGMVGLAFATLTAAATFRVRLYALESDVVPLLDENGMCCAGANFDEFAWGMVPMGVNAYSYGGGAYGVLWLTQVHACQKIVLDITDVNPLNYIEASRLVCGTYWEPVYTAEAGVTVGVIDNTKNERTDAGDLRSDRGTQHKTLSFDLSVMPREDRDALYNILRGNGLFKPMFVSVDPESLDEVGEQVFQIYGKLSRSGNIKWQHLNMFSTRAELEEL